VSDIASAEGQENREGAQSESVEACKAKDVSDDKTEKAKDKGDKTAKKLDHNEDKSEHKAFGECVSG
jgi:hypothetical protein